MEKGGEMGPACSVSPLKFVSVLQKDTTTTLQQFYTDCVRTEPSSSQNM